MQEKILQIAESLYIIGTDTYFFKIGELFKMDYSAVSQAAKRFEQKS